MQFIDLDAQYRYLKANIDKRIHKVLEHGRYIMGPEVQELERELALFVGTKHALTCGNGTDALQLALMVLDVKEGDAVFCPTFTFFASAEVISYANATPVFVDVESNSFNICPEDLERRIEETISQGKLKPKAIIAVDLFGLPADYKALTAVAEKYDMKLIEDSAQGFGGGIARDKSGSFGDIATTSFFPAKPLGCYGDGGAIFTDNDEYADLIKSIRVHGKGLDKYDNVRIGVNSRLDTIQAAVLLEKLAVFPKELVQRQQVADYYSNGLKNDFVTPQVACGYASAWAQYTLLVDDREAIIEALTENGIPSMIYYAICMHQQTAFSDLGYQAGDFPVAESLSNKVLSIPMHPYLSTEQQDKVIRILLKNKKGKLV